MGFRFLSVAGNRQLQSFHETARHDSGFLMDSPTDVASSRTLPTRFSQDDGSKLSVCVCVCACMNVLMRICIVVVGCLCGMFVSCGR